MMTLKPIIVGFGKSPSVRFGCAAADKLIAGLPKQLPKNLTALLSAMGEIHVVRRGDVCALLLLLKVNLQCIALWVSKNAFISQKIALLSKLTDVPAIIAEIR